MVVTVAVKNVRRGRPCAINQCLFKGHQMEGAESCICFSSPDTVSVVFTEEVRLLTQVYVCCPLRVETEEMPSHLQLGFFVVDQCSQLWLHMGDLKTLSK